MGLIFPNFGEMSPIKPISLFHIHATHLAAHSKQTSSPVYMLLSQLCSNQVVALLLISILSIVIFELLQMTDIIFFY